MRDDITTTASLPPAWWPTALKYFAAVCAALLIGEGAVRLSAFTPAQWYPRIIETLDGVPARYLFAGTSRVGSGVNVLQFADAQPPLAPGDQRQVFNMGHGFSTIISHAIGLRHMAEAGLLRGAVVFVEAPGGVPDESTWNGRWYFREAPSFLVSVAGARDMPGFWRSQMSADDKIGASARAALKFSKLAVYAEMIRVNGLSAAYRRASQLRSSAPGAQPAAVERLELREGGGVRGDVDDLSRISAAAIVEGRRMLDEQTLVADWGRTVSGEIVDIVRGGGGEVAFFDMPLSAPMRIAAESETGQRNGESFGVWAAARGVRVLRSREDYPAALFPDVWHMSATGADMFTRELINEWGRREP